jgi:hypothetical protein
MPCLERQVSWYFPVVVFLICGGERLAGPGDSTRNTHIYTGLGLKKSSDKDLTSYIFMVNGLNLGVLKDELREVLSSSMVGDEMCR